MVFVRVGSARIVGRDVRFEAFDPDRNRTLQYVVPEGSLRALDGAAPPSSDLMECFLRHRREILDAVETTAASLNDSRFVLDFSAPAPVVAMMGSVQGTFATA